MKRSDDEHDYVRGVLAPAIRGSFCVVLIVPREHETDGQFAVQLGLAIMLDKPIVALLSPGVRVTQKLARVVDLSVECCPKETLNQRLAEAIKGLRAKMAKEGARERAGRN